MRAKILRVFLRTKYAAMNILCYAAKPETKIESATKKWRNLQKMVETSLEDVHKLSGNALGIWICGCRCILESSGSENSGCTKELEASKSAGAKGDVPKICGFVHPLHPL